MTFEYETPRAFPSSPFRAATTGHEAVVDGRTALEEDGDGERARKRR